MATHGTTVDSRAGGGPAGQQSSRLLSARRRGSCIGDLRRSFERRSLHRSPGADLVARRLCDCVWFCADRRRHQAACATGWLAALDGSAITIDAAGVGQAVPIGNVGAAVIGTLVLVSVGRSVIAGECRRTRQQRRAEPWGDVWVASVGWRGHHLLISVVSVGVRPAIGIRRIIRNGGSEIVMRPRQPRGQYDGRAVPAATGEGAVGAVSGSASGDNDQQCNRKMQHRLLRMIGLSFGEYIAARGAGEPPQFEIWLRSLITGRRNDGRLRGQSLLKVGDQIFLVLN